MRAARAELLRSVFCRVAPVMLLGALCLMPRAAVGASPSADASGRSPLCGSNDVLLCRGGIEQGSSCGADSDCPQGVCTRMGHPRRCRVAAHCNVSSTVRCRDNLDCPLFPFKDPTDWCPRVTALKDCNKDDDCGAGGECVNGVAQCEYEPPHVSSGAAGDLVGDWVIGLCSLEDGVYNAPSASSLATAVGVEFDPGPPRRLYATDFFRVTAFEGDRITATTSPASTVIGQATLDWRVDHVGHRLPGDLTVGGFYSQGPRTLGRQFDRAARAVSTPDMQALWITDMKRVGRYARAAGSNAAMDLVLGDTDFVGTRAQSIDRQLEHASDVDAQQRCVAGARIGTPCKRNAECPKSECATTLAIADCEYNRIAVWRRPPRENGQAIDVCLGQPDCASTQRNRGGATAVDSLRCPRAVAFDSKGNLWVADGDNNRVLRFSHDFEQGSHAASLVFGQSGFKANQAGVGESALSTFEGPGVGIDFDSDDNLAIADVGNSRVLFVPPPYTKATRVIGAMSLETSGPGLSSDGTKCDRLTAPRDLVFDDANNLWVADSNNGRLLRFPAGFSTTGAVADVMQGQIDCRTYHYLHVSPTSFGRGHGHGAAILRTGQHAGMACFGDSQDNRILCWHDVAAARSGMPPADFVLGQTSAYSFVANLPERSASTLEYPMLMDFVGGKKPRLVVADRENHRVLGYPVADLQTAAAADLVLGQQGSFSAAACGAQSGTTAGSLCRPTSARGDEQGNVWVADHATGRVLLFCFGSPGSASGICEAKNTGDTVADLVLGKPDFDAGYNAEVCESPTASTLCQPYDVVSDPARQRVIISDQRVASNAGRVLIYEYPLTNGMAATGVIGIPSGRFDTYEPSRYGVCWGGPSEGVPCDYVELNAVPAGSSPKTCVGGSAAHSECAKDADCEGGVCGCRSPGVCDFSRSLASVTSVDALAVHPTQDVLWVGKGPHVLEYRGPLKSGMRATRAGGFTVPHNFHRGSTGYTECQWDRLGGGFAFDGEDNLYVPQGGAEELAAVLILADPLRAPAGRSPQ